MNLKELTRPILSWMFGIAIIVGFFMGKIPVEAFLPLAAAAIMYWFEEQTKEKEIARLLNLRNTKSHEKK